MSISLQKGQRIDLTKGRSGLSKLMVGLGWDPVQKKGLFSGGHNIDCDASVIMLNSDGKLENMNNLIYFRNLKSSCGGVVHSGDNLTGAGEGDDEQILVDLSKISPSVHKLRFVVNIFQCQSRGQDFGMIKNAFIRLVDKSNGEELIKFNLTDDYKGKTALIVGEVYRHNSEWKFAALGEGTTDVSITEIASKLSI